MADQTEPDAPDDIAAQDPATAPDGVADDGAATAPDEAADPVPESPDLSPIGDEGRRALEAVLMVAEQPIEAGLLAQLIERSPQQVEDLLAGLAASYDEDGRGFQLVRVAGGWRYQSHEDLAPYVERFILSGQTARLSAAALETLAIVAYKQPISRAQVSAIRGVNVDGVMRTLQQRGYIAEVGKDPGPGQPSMFGTTALFLEKLGLNDVSELPSLGDFIPGADVVELLEQGLRAEADAPPPEAPRPDSPQADAVQADAGQVDAVEVDAVEVEAAAHEVASDGPVADVVDLTDEVVIDLDHLDGAPSGVDGEGPRPG